MNYFLILISISWAQTDLVFPWITNNAQFQGTIIVNNLSAEQVEVELVATRPSGDQQIAHISLPAFGQYVAKASQVFEQLGSGSGFSVRLRSSSDLISGGFVNEGTGSDSGSSPAQANPIPFGTASNDLIFNFMPTTSTRFSAPVIYNASDESLRVTVRAFRSGYRSRSRRTKH